MIAYRATSLPDGLRFFDRRMGAGRQYVREQNALEMLYNNTKILINRPCLCRLDRRIVNQTASSNDFNERSAITCVASAKAIAQLLPNDPDRDLVILYESGQVISTYEVHKTQMLTIRFRFSGPGGVWCTTSCKALLFCS